MSTKSGRGQSAHSAAMPANPYALLSDLPRRQLAMLAQSASAMFRGSEAVRVIQQQAAQRASAHHEEIAERLRGDCDLADLVAIQSELLRYNMQEAVQYWQQLAGASMKLQAEMVAQAQDAALEGTGEPTLDTLQRAFAATLNGGAAASAAH